MADNLYDYLNRFNLGQLGTSGQSALQGAANFLNKAGIGTRTATKKPLSPALNRPVGTQAVLGGKPVYWGGNDYGWQQLSGGGSSTTLQSLNRALIEEPKTLAAISDPIERAYLEEKNRVAQMAAQNPDLQRYEKARAAAKTQEEMNAARDIGMQIWAQKNPALAAKIKPGSSGYGAIQGVIGGSTPSALSNEQVLGLMSFDPNTVLSTTQNVQNKFRPNQALTDQEILAAMSFDPNVAMRSAANMAYAPLSSTEAAMLQEVGGPRGEYITPMPNTGTTTQSGIPLVTPAEQRRKESDAFSQLLQGIRQYGGTL